MAYQKSLDVLISRAGRGEFAMVKRKKTVKIKKTAEQIEAEQAKTIEQAHRLWLIRKRIHNMRHQHEMAKKLEVAYARYNNWERGVQAIPTDQASKLKDITPGIDLDWIFDGEEDGLSVAALKILKDKSS